VIEIAALPTNLMGVTERTGRAGLQERRTAARALA